MNTILNHRSIRKYKSDSVSQEKIDQIIKAATRASTTGNMQLYSIIVNRSEESRDAVSPFHFNQPMVRQAPLLLTFCADVNRFSKWCEQRDAEPAYDNMLWFVNAATDAIIAAQNAAVAAEDLGLGICYLGTTVYMAEQLIEYYKCPKGVVPLTTLVIGYPDEAPPLTDRLPIQAVVHEEKYHDYSSDSINELWAKKEQLKETQQLIEENQTDNLAQIFTEKRYKKADNIHFSETFLEVLKKQGFLKRD